MAHKQLNIRAPEAEIEAWKAAAWESKLSLSAWMRNTLNGVPIFEAPEVKIPPKVATKPQNSACIRRTPKGSFCKGCGKTH